jgi:hypothetical protein
MPLQLVEVLERANRELPSNRKNLLECAILRTDQ